jgi:hypothetical protein
VNFGQIEVLFFPGTVLDIVHDGREIFEPGDVNDLELAIGEDEFLWEFVGVEILNHLVEDVFEVVIDVFGDFFEEVESEGLEDILGEEPEGFCEGEEGVFEEVGHFEEDLVDLWVGFEEGGLVEGHDGLEELDELFVLFVLKQVLQVGLLRLGLGGEKSLLGGDQVLA